MSDDSTRVWKMMKAIDYCMLVTHGRNGMRSRPMSSIIDLDKRTLHFLSDVKSAKDDEIQTDPEIHLAYSNGSNQFVAVQARGSVSHDRALIKMLWNPGAQAFWPDGPEKADVCVLVVQPVAAQYWDGDGKVLAAAKFAASLVTGRAVEPGEEGRTAL